MKAQRVFQLLYSSILAFGVWSTSAWSETIDCTAITLLPYTITTQGVYCLTGNLNTNMTTGNAITINTNNVIIDLNGFKLGGLAGGDGTTATGIYAFQRKNITIKNGIIRGFYYGISINNESSYTTSQGHVITDVLADQNTRVGIFVQGRGNTIRRNTVMDTGGSTITNAATGIVVYGPGNNVLDNQMNSTIGETSSIAVGIFLQNAHASMLKNNRISQTNTPIGNGYGIYIDSSFHVVASNNIIVEAEYGIYYNDSNGKYMDNLTANVTTEFTGGTAVGTND